MNTYSHVVSSYHLLGREKNEWWGWHLTCGTTTTPSKVKRQQHNPPPLCHKSPLLIPMKPNIMVAARDWKKRKRLSSTGKECYTWLQYEMNGHPTSYENNVGYISFIRYQYFCLRGKFLWCCPSYHHMIGCLLTSFSSFYSISPPSIPENIPSSLFKRKPGVGVPNV